MAKALAGFLLVIPAKAGNQCLPQWKEQTSMDPRFRGDDAIDKAARGILARHSREGGNPLSFAMEEQTSMDPRFRRDDAMALADVLPIIPRRRESSVFRSGRADVHGSPLSRG